MVPWLRKAIAFFLILILFSTSGIFGDDNIEYKIMTEEWPPYNYREEGTLKGISVEILDLMLRRSGSHQSIADMETYPWARAYKTIQEQPDTILFTMLRTEAREDLFKWVGPIQILNFNIYGLKSRNLQISSVDDLSNHTFATLRDDAEEELLIEKGNLTYDHFFRANSVQHVVRLISEGRFDLMLFSDNTIGPVSRETGVDPEIFEPLMTLDSLELYYAFNRETPDSEIEKLQEILDHLKEKEIVNEIIESYN